MRMQNRGGHLGRHLELHSYSNLSERLSTWKLLLRVEGIQPYTATSYSKAVPDDPPPLAP